MVPLGALGTTEEADYVPVEGLENWTHEVDSATLEPGEYNLLVRATDNAGNQSLSDPRDVQLDPVSDTPTVSISTPEPNQVVGERLLILGTGDDDDAVEQVRVQLNDRPVRTATGTDYWSHSVDLSGLEDGAHVLRAVAVDSGGTESEPVEVPFVLDTGGPGITVAEPAIGATVGGRVTVAGTVQDPNGMVEVRIRVEAGDGVADGAVDPPETGQADAQQAESEPTALFADAQRIRRQRREDNFSFRVDTREMPDGPLIVWITAEDVNGNITEQPLLLLADNQAPTVRIDQVDENGAFPPDVGFPGDVVISGRIDDTSGITTFTYQLRGGEAQEIERTAGDPYFALPLSFRDAGDQARVDFRVVDNAGNETTRRIDIPLTPEEDLPVLEVLPTAGPRAIAGWASDDDGVAAVEYRIDGADEWQEIETAGAFALQLDTDAAGDPLPPGVTTVGLRAVDINGLTGPEIEVQRTIPPSVPLLGLPQLEIEQGDGQTGGDLLHGVVLTGPVAAAVRGTVDPGPRPGEVDRIRYRIDGGDWDTAGLSPVEGEGRLLEYRFELDDGEAGGSHTIEVEVDTAAAPGIESQPTVADRFSTWYYRFDIVPEEPDPEATYVTEVPDPPELRLEDGRLDEPVGSGDALRFRNDRPLVASVPGVELVSAALDPPIPGTDVTVVEGAAVVTPVASFAGEGARLVVAAADGTEWTSDPIDLSFDDTAPTLSVTAPSSGGFVSRLPAALVDATDDDEVAAVTVSIDGADPRPLAPAEDGSYGGPLPAEIAEGPVVLEFAARDRWGNETRTVSAVVIDSTAPEVELVSPLDEDPVNGSLRVAIAVNDSSPVRSISWQPDGEDGAVAVEPAALIEVPIELQGRDPDAPPPTVVVTDRAGNRSSTPVDLNIDPGSDRPVVALQLPVDESVHREDFVVSGTVFDDDGPAEVWYRIDDGEPQSLGATTSFSFSVAIAEVGDNEHTIEVFARDTGGVESESVRRRVRISLDPPTGGIVSPTIDRRTRGAVSLRGTASDPNGIESVAVSIDNGISFSEAAPTPGAEGEAASWEEWSFDLDTAVLVDGLHAVQYRITDDLGTEALFSHLLTVDNTPPSLVVTAPENRAILGPELSLQGRVLDTVDLDGVSYRITPLDGAGDPGAGSAEWTAVDLLPGGVLRATVPAPQTAGGWNVAVRATDAAGNVREVARNVRTTAELTDVPSLRVLSPLDGERRAGRLVVSGIVPRFGRYDTVLVSVDGAEPEELRPDLSGRFWLQLERTAGSFGVRSIEIRAVSAIGAPDLVQTRQVEQTEFGPWIRVESHQNGELVGSRPTIAGLAGYFFPAVEGVEPGSRAFRRETAPFAIDRVEVSLDNGKTFDEARGTEEWEYRIPTEDLRDGALPVLVRATAADGETAVRRTVLRLDTRPPDIAVDQPRDGFRFNDPIFVSGTAGDENGLERVELVVREGSKNRYEVPEFIQGLYLDIHALGATQWDFGAGLTFFDDNVKLQAQVGQAPSGRFSGTVLGGKLLANVASLPLSFVLGPDWDFLSGALAVGANFSYFSMEDDPRTDSGLVLGGIVGQLEFPIIHRNARFLNAFSLYTELQFWFISSDVQGGTETKLSFGLRTQLL